MVALSAEMHNTSPQDNCFVLVNVTMLSFLCLKNWKFLKKKKMQRDECASNQHKSNTVQI